MKVGCDSCLLCHGCHRLSIAKADIIKVSDQSPIVVLRQRDIGRILLEHRQFWRLARGTSLTAFIAFLLERTKLRCVRLKLPHRPETLYTWGDVSPFLLATAAKPGAYLCHYTAMRLHELTD